MNCRMFVLLLVAAANAADIFQTDVCMYGSSGLRFRIKDREGISAVVITSYYGQDNTKTKTTKIEGKTSEDFWEYADDQAKVKPGDLVNYKTSVQYNDNWVHSEWITVPANYQLAPVRSLRRVTVFRDDFNSWNPSSYEVEVSSWGGGNHEFQVYVPESNNVYVSNGRLYLKPTYTVDNPHFNWDILYGGRMDLNSLYHTCTNSNNWGCDRTVYGGEILPPIMSGKVTTHAAIKYGRVNVRAQIPKGDWIWPAIWMLPRDWVYGSWPRSGEIDLMEARGNTKLVQGGNDHGIGEIASTLHWGPAANQNKFYLTHAEKDKGNGDWHGWHTYSLEWTDSHIITYVDDQQILRVDTPSNGFWGKGGFSGSNPWHSNNAPFDQYFKLLLNVAIGGDYFPDGAQYNTHKPWHRGSSHPMRDFWEGRHLWEHTWQGDNVAMIIDYVEMIQY